MSSPADKTETKVSIEELLAGKWLTWVGAVAVIIAVGFFFKYTIDTGLIGETGRVVLGVLGGMACFAGGAFAMLRNYRWLSQSLVGAALGILYFSLFAGYRWYQLMPQEIAFGGMILSTAAVLSFAGYFKAQPTAILGLIGGFLTPVMLSTGQDAQWSLFAYIFLLDAGVLGLATFRKWQPTQVLAFVATLFMWLGWIEQHYAPVKMSATLILMTAFFVLFALLGVWHNIIRREQAKPADFFLILATPIAYFGGLYAVTLNEFSALHGLLAIAMAAVYLALGFAALSRHPEGRRAIIAMGGIAASFLTLAIPLQFTGHWVVIAWAAESLLLVELGLRFNEVRLRQAGFGLLIFVQMLLVYYSAGTFLEPNRFQTRFTRIDPIALETLPGSARRPAVNSTPDDPPWTSIFNGRSLSFLASVLVLAVLGWEYRTRFAATSDQPSTVGTKISDPTRAGPRSLLGIWLHACVPLVAWAMLIVESFAFGHARHWRFPNFTGMFLIWTSLIAVSVALMSRLLKTRELRIVTAGVFTILGALLAITFVGTLAGWPLDWRSLETVANGGLWNLFIFNPRGLGFLFAIAASCFVAFLFRDNNSEQPTETEWERQFYALPLKTILGLFANITALMMLTAEVYAQGVVRDWGTTSSLLITIVWTCYAIGTLIAGIYFRSSSIRVLSLSLFLLTTSKVFFYDIWHLSTAIRFIAFGGLGVSLFLVSFLYRRYRERIRAWMTPVLIAILVPLAGVSNSTTAYAADSTENVLERLTHRYPIDAEETSTNVYGEMVLPPDIYGIARRDLGDLRILSVDVDSEACEEIPYVLSRKTDEKRAVTHKAEMLNLSEVDGSTQFLLALGETREPINEIDIGIQSTDRNYERPVKIFAANQRDPKDWNLLTDKGYVLDVSRSGHRFQVHRVHFPKSQFAFYKVEIHNGDLPPLKITGASILDHIHLQAPRIESPAQIVSKTTSAETKQTIVVFDFGYDRLPSVGIKLDINFVGNYYRTVQLDASDSLEEPIDWRTVRSGQLYRIQRLGVNVVEDHLEYQQITGRYLRLTINNGDDRPLQIAGCTAESLEQTVVVQNRHLNIAGREIALYTGSERLQPPRYDLAKTIGSTRQLAASKIRFRPVEKNPFFTGPIKPKLPWSEEHQGLLWTVTICGVVILGTLTAFMLKNAAHDPGSD
ncbi:DUF2339 domain-containing protein [Symmachiella macrocystis]|nr:DUF2339 domain-containing protein [Symmachiella macrocystis]